MKNRVLLIVACAFAIIANVIILFPYRDEPVMMIAHGGGEIDGIGTPNCIEAVNRSIENGIKYIELDLQLSSDSQLVALHDWRRFHVQTYHDADSSPISLEEFKSRKIFGKYTPITGEWISSLLSSNDTVVLVTDKISDPLIINNWFYKYRDRVIVECFSLSDYRELDTLGYTCMLSCGRMPHKKPWSRIKAWRMRSSGLFVPQNYAFWSEIKDFTHSGLLSKFILWFHCLNSDGEWFAIWTAKDLDEAKRIGKISPRIRYVYVDETVK